MNAYPESPSEVWEEMAENLDAISPECSEAAAMMRKQAALLREQATIASAMSTDGLSGQSVDRNKREQAKGTLTGTTDEGKHYGVHGSAESINVLSDYLHRLEQVKGAQGEAVRTWAVSRSLHSYYTHDEDEARQAEFDGAQVREIRADTAPRAAVPDGMLDRIDAAIQRIMDGHAPRRIPADPTDVDLVLAEVRSWITGKGWPPFWISAAPSDGGVKPDSRKGFMPNGTRATWQDSIGREHPCTITGWHPETYDARLDDGVDAKGYARGRFSVPSDGGNHG